MTDRIVIDGATGRSRRVTLTAQEIAARQARAAEEVAKFTVEDNKRAAREVALQDTPAGVNSIPALRDEIDKLKQILRGDL